MKHNYISCSTKFINYVSCCDGLYNQMCVKPYALAYMCVRYIKVHVQCAIAYQYSYTDDAHRPLSTNRNLRKRSYQSKEINERVHVCKYICIYIYIRTYLHIYMYICICTNMYINVRVYGYACMYIYIYMKLCVYMHVYIRMNILHAALASSCRTDPTRWNHRALFTWFALFVDE